MTGRRFTGRREQHAAVPRVGLFGHLGADNIGNDASMEAVLGYLRAAHPDAILDAMCTGPDRVSERYSIAAIHMSWHKKYGDRPSGGTGMALKVLGKAVDVARTASWARRHDAVIVPGMGVLEASLPLRPWGIPYAMFLLSVTSRLFGTQVAMVSVGAGTVNQWLTRWLATTAARLCIYRSYRDAVARESMRWRGLDITRDRVYPDLAFALPAPPYEPGDADIVAVGVMDYRGSNDDRKQADEIYSAYVAEMKRFVRWLVDSGRKVRLLVGDTNGSDDGVVQEILADLHESRPGLDPSQVVAEPVSTFADIMRAMLPASSVVAIRFHNIICALKLCKPTIAISYSPKHDALMADMGVADLRQPVRTLDADALIDQFKEMESRSAQLRQTIAEHNEANVRLLDEQFTELSALLFPETAPMRITRSPASVSAENTVVPAKETVHE